MGETFYILGAEAEKTLAKFQTITQCFDSKEHYQKNKYFKF